MGCYCSEIRQGNKEVRALRNILTMIDRLIRDGTYIEQDLSALAGMCDTAFKTENMELLQAALKKRNAGIISEMERVEMELGRAVSDLENRISSWSDSDERYHEEENDDD